MMSRPGRVIVVGSANMDLVAYGERLPSPGETVLAKYLSRSPGGKGANQAIAASRSGAETIFIGALGQDAFGDEILRSLSDARVNVEHSRRIGSAQTGVALITVDADGRNLITVVPGANGAADSGISENVGALLGPGTIVLLQLEIPMETVTRVAALAHSAGATVILNPAPVRPLPWELSSCVDILVPNEIELRGLSTKGTPGMSLGELAREYIRGTTRAVVVTMGAEGALVVTAKDEKRLAAHHVEVIDTTGAGDTFVGALACRIAAGDGLDEAVEYANAAAALKVQAKGAQTSIPGSAEVSRFMSTMQQQSASK